MALTDLTRISTSGIATGTSLSGAILHGDAHFRGTQVGVTSALFDSSDDALEFNDNVKLKFGNSGDLSIYHNGSDNYIDGNSNAEDHLYIRANVGADHSSNIHLQAKSGEESIVCRDDESVELYFNGNQKLRTTNEGAVVTGILTATGFSGPTNNTSGIATFYDLRVSNNLTVEGTTTTLDTNVTGVDRLEVNANSNSNTAIVGIQSGTADIINLFDGTTEVLTVTDGGKVGIGSVIPSAKLDVSGSGSSSVIRGRRTDSNGGYNIFEGYSDINGANVFTVSNNGAGYFKGNVGIGSADPGSPLEVSGGTALDTATFNTHHANGVLINLQRSGTSKGFLGSGKNIADATGGVDDIGLRSNANLIFTSGGGIERLRIDSGGRLFTGGSTQVLDATVGALHVSGGTSGGRIAIRGTTTSADAGLAEIFAFWDTNKVAGMIAKSGGDTTNKDDGKLLFYTADGSGVVERLRITSAGLVKINSASPVVGTNGENALLQVKSVSQYDGLLLGHGYDYGTIGRGTAGALIYTGNASPGNLGGTETTMHEWWSGSAGGGGPNRLMVLTTSGNLGIGVTNPDQRLKIHGNVETNAYDSAGGSGGYYTAKGLIIGNAYDAGITGLTDDRNGIIWQERGLDLDFGTNNTFRMKIDYNGNVGINTTLAGSQTWRSGRRLEIFGGGGNVTGELHLGANRGDGAQSVGSINFFDNTQDSTHRHIAIIEADKAGSTSNKRGGDLLFYTKGDNVAAPTVKLRITSTGIIDAPTQTGFYARMASDKDNVMGGSAAYYTVLFDTVSGSICYNQDNAYATGTGLYTVPAGGDGHYMFSTAVCLSTQCYGRGGEAWFLVGSNRYFFDRKYFTSTSGTITGYYGTSIIKLTAGQTVGVQAFISGGSTDVDVLGASSANHITWFTGRKIP